MFSFRSFTVTNHVLKSSRHCWSNKKSTFQCFTWNIQSSHCHLLKRLSFPIASCWHHCKKSVKPQQQKYRPCIPVFISELSILLHCLFMPISRCLMIVELQYYLKSRVIWPSNHIINQDCFLAIRSPLLYRNFAIFPSFAKIVIVVLIGVTVNLWSSWQVTRIFKMLSVPVQEHVHFILFVHSVFKESFMFFDVCVFASFAKLIATHFIWLISFLIVFNV